MTAERQPSEPAERRVIPLSLKAWHAMIEAGLAPSKAELIRGVIYEKVSKSFLHTSLASRLARLLDRAVGDSHWVRREDPLSLPLNDSEPEPDVSVVAGQDTDYAPHHPQSALLVIEVAVSTLTEDRRLAELYATAGVAEYWIVDATRRCIEVHTGPQPGGYQSVRAECAMVQSQALPAVRVDIATLFAGLSID